MDTQSALTTVSCLVGILSHQLIFIRGEWHIQAPLLLKIYSTLTVTTFILNAVYRDEPLTRSFTSSVVLISGYGLSVFASMLVYRLCFHRIRHFPGPTWAAATKFWHVLRCVQSGSRNHLVLDQLYEQYGDFVRTGPTEITVFHPDVFLTTDGPGNTCTKAVWYDFLLPEVAINTTRDKKKHDWRRRIWDRGLNAKALAEYQDRIKYYADQLEVQIAASASEGEDVDVTSVFYWFSFDVMGEFAFANDFDMLRDEKWHHAIILLRKAMSLLGPLSPVPWLAQIGFYLIPNLWIVKDWHTMMRWCKDRMAQRIEINPKRLDVSSCLIEASVRNDSLEKDRHWLNGDSIAIIIAGSDTVAPSMVFIFYELAKHPEHAELLRDELRNVIIDDPTSLQRLPHLNGIINEVLRIHPPVPSGGYRETPDEGVVIGGQFIPGGITIVAPRYTIGRLESCFESPHCFVPERWYSQPQMVRNRKAFAPFSQGRYSCVGKNLALAELRYVTALLVQKYHIEIALQSGEARTSFQVKDQFTAAPERLHLKFSPSI